MGEGEALETKRVMSYKNSPTSAKASQDRQAIYGNKIDIQEEPWSKSHWISEKLRGIKICHLGRSGQQK